MKIDETNNRHLIADEGKVFRRIADGWIAGSEIFLGCTYQIGGKKLDSPLAELPEHFEEIDDPAFQETVLLDDATTLDEEVQSVEVFSASPSSPHKVTLSDYRELENRVKMLMKILNVEQ